MSNPIGSQADIEATGDGTAIAILKRLRSLLSGGLPASLGQKTMANSLAVTVAGDQSAITVSEGTPASATVPAQVIKTVAAIATPEALAADNTFFQSAMLIGKKAARTPNTGTVYLGIGSSNDSQALEIAPGETWTINAPTGQKYDLNDWYLDVGTAGDGVVIIYS